MTDCGISEASNTSRGDSLVAVLVSAGWFKQDVQYLRRSLLTLRYRPLHVHIQHTHTSHCLYILTLIYCAVAANKCVSSPGYRKNRCIWIEGSRLDPANGAAVGMR